MKFSYSHTYPKGKADVLKMFCDPAFHEHLQKELGARNFRQLQHEDDGTKFRIKMAYEVTTSVPLPGFAKKILGENSNVEQTETWDRSTGRGHVSVDVKGLPGTLECDTSLSDKGKGCNKNFDWTVTVKVPLVGGKIEKLITEDIKNKSPMEETAGNKLLGKY